MFKCSFLFSKKWVRSSKLSQDCLISSHSWWTICRFDTMTSPSDRLRSYEVKYNFASNFYRIEIEQQGWFQRVSLASMQQLVCNMTYLHQHVTLCDLDWRPKFNLDLLMSTQIYFDTSWQEEYDGVWTVSQTFLVQKSFMKKHWVLRLSLNT